MDPWDLVRQLSSRGKGDKLGQLFNAEGCLETGYRVLNLTTNLGGDQGQQQKVSWSEEPFPLFLVFVLIWLTCFLLLGVLPWVVTDRKTNMVLFPMMHQVMGDFRQLGKEPGQDGWENWRIR